QPSNIILGISGKYNQKHFSELVRKNWSVLRQKATDGWKKSKDSQNSLRAKIEYKKTEQAHLSLGFKGFAYNDSRNTAQLILSVILGGGMSSRLFTEVREKRGLAYYISASGSNFQDTGIFNVRASVPIDKIQGALKVIISELVKVKREEVREDELKKAKEYVKGRTVLALEDNQARLDWFLERAAFYKKIETPKQMFRKIDAVSLLDVQKAAKDLFKAKKLTLAVIGPYRNKKLFNKLINID
ncbi:MAG: pitrilysin family protein, partial [Candidatus Doudnabacteria bacterium]|nr:pitrilysin family protein [Candidatus Doudnabacteria bacterium]